MDILHYFFGFDLVGYYLDAGCAERVNRRFVDDADLQFKELSVHVIAGEFVVPDDEGDAVAGFGRIPGSLPNCSIKSFKVLV